MKPLIPVLIVATTSLAVASVQFARQASAQRERADTEMALRQKQDVRVAQLERNQARLERDLMLARGASGAASPGTAGGPPPPGSRTGGRFGFADRAQGDREGPPQEFFRGGLPRMLESPAARNFLRSSARNSIRRMYEDVGSALGLSADKKNQFIDLLADQQTRNMGRPPMPPDGETWAQARQEEQKKNGDEIKALIGPDKLDAWAAYQKTLPDRAQLDVVRNQLEQAGVPMTDSQRTEMLAAISDETQRNPRPTFSAGASQEDTTAQTTQWQSDYDKALLDRAKQVLTTEQYNSYKEFQDWQTEMRNSMPRGPGGQRGIARIGFVSPGGVVGTDSATFIAAPPPPPPQGR